MGLVFAVEVNLCVLCRWEVTLLAVLLFEKTKPQLQEKSRTSLAYNTSLIARFSKHKECRLMEEPSEVAQLRPEISPHVVGCYLLLCYSKGPQSFFWPVATVRILTQVVGATTNGHTQRKPKRSRLKEYIGKEA